MADLQPSRAASLTAVLRDAGLTGAQEHASTMAARLPALNGPRAEVRQLFILFYTVTDDICVVNGPNGAVVDLSLIDAVQRCVVDIIESGQPVNDTGLPGRIFQYFWYTLKKNVPANEHDRLAALFRGMVHAMGVKYRCISSRSTLPMRKFFAIRRQIPVLPFMELERALRGVPPADTVAKLSLRPLTEAVSDCISWTNDLHSAKKERNEGFNLVLLTRDARRITSSEASEEVRRLIAGRRTTYADASVAFRSDPGSPVEGLLALYDDLLAAVTPLHEQALRYR
ncbi:terpene synthase family protein [Streptomyces sp. NPDC048663]|uniref:terpene synthase family protein n=1 Tax=Streptomyces sp. NPDC048663 TaxID=3155638 RepID=UPI00344038F5